MEQLTERGSKMAVDRRIKIVEGLTDRIRIYGTRKPIASVDHEGFLIEVGKIGYEHIVQSELKNILNNNKNVQMFLNIAKLPGVVLIEVFRYDIQVTIGYGFDWDELHDQVIDYLKKIHHLGNEVEVIDETAKKE